MKAYRYECEVCGEVSTVRFSWQSTAPKAIDCPVCGCTGKAVRLPAAPANHYRPTRSEA